ncbi:MAG: YHYH domain-containing protein [Oleispira sp.]|nr:YHYH domain-containing protein [Oleispira sp.]MBL4880838.1 YHYH domain-containing protein [Oleispira sp.]
MIKIILFIAISSASLTSFAHSGGTDSEGCHSGSKEYHCHNRK